MEMELRNLSSEFKQKYDIDKGVMVTDTENAFLYKRLGIARGAIITGINDLEIKNVEDIADFKERYGDAINSLEKLKYIIDSSMEEKEVYFTKPD